MDVKRVMVFTFSFVLAFVFYRLLVYFKQGNVSFLRGITGLNVHHYHYGVIFITIALVLVLFYKISRVTVALAGFGLGSVLDGFISSMFPSVNRVEEIINYSGNFIPTMVLFIGVVLLVLLVSRSIKY